MLAEPSPENPAPPKKTHTTPTTDPSEEGLALARLAEDTVRAFARVFPGQVTLAPPDPFLQRLVAIDPGSERAEKFLLDLVAAAYAARAGDLLVQRRIDVVHRQAKQNAVAERASMRQAVDDMVSGLPEIMEKARASLSGEKVLRVQDLARQADLIRRLTADGPTRPPYEPSEEGSSSSSPTTGPEEGEKPSSAEGASDVDSGSASGGSPPDSR
jgi:hypothetical protein